MNGHLAKTLRSYHATQKLTVNDDPLMNNILKAAGNCNKWLKNRPMKTE